VGGFLGVIFVMSQQMLILFAIFANRAQLSGQTKKVVQAQEALATFCFFIFLVYMLFGGLLAVFRHDIIQEGRGICYSRFGFPC
jgi:hypothetical protein